MPFLPLLEYGLVLYRPSARSSTYRPSVSRMTSSPEGSGGWRSRHD